MNRRRAAEVQVLMSAVFFSTAGLFMGVIDVGVWAIVFWRSLFALVFTAILVLALPDHALARPDRSGVLAALLSAGAMVAFIHALSLTSVANVAVIHGLLPLLTALLAWLLLKERVSLATLGLCVAAGFGAALIFSGSISSGMRIAGDSLALVMTMSMALMTIAFRRSASSNLMLVALSNGFAVLAGACIAPSLSLSIEMAGLLACFAFLQMTLGLICYTAGCRLLPPADTALISLVEVPLSTFWVWLAFGATPPWLTIAGGGVIMSSVVVYLGAPGRRDSSSRILRDVD